MGEQSLGQGRKVVIVGAGFSGLVSAFYLSRSGFQVEIFEERERSGGLISTREMNFGLVETAANGLLNSSHVEDLFADIGVELLPSRSEARKRFIFRDGRPSRFPLKWRGVFELLSSLFRYFFFRKSMQPNEGETVRDWGQRAIGKEVTTYLIEAALQGIYAGDPGRMSASVIFSRLFSPQKAKVSRKPKVRGTVSARNGMGSVIEALEKYLLERGVVIHYKRKFSFEGRHPYPVPVVIAGSAPQAAAVLSDYDRERSGRLGKLELVPIVTTTLNFQDPLKSAQGFGCLFPPAERRKVLGVLMNGFIFENRVRTGASETWIMGGATQSLPGLFEKTDEEILRLIQDEREIAFGERGVVQGFVVTRWPKAIPHYTVELEWQLPHLQGLRDNVILMGNYLGAIGLSKILDRAREIPNEISEGGRWF